MERRLGDCGFCGCRFAVRVRGMQVEQSPSALSVKEGTITALRGSFLITVGSVQWFPQNPRGGLICVFSLTPEIKQNGRLKSTINSKELYSSLHISALQLEDSGSYPCAAKTQVAYSLVLNCSWAVAIAFALGGEYSSSFHIC
uniref:Ig-like domain-containing protein n=1 Tax=Castor canadensis TaxID=51338 RepID=A0A8C0WUZ0_CASCN